jgi:putative (di)nucleoside polyphosphate hydrolase
MPDEKPYRPNVGIALFNASGRVLIGRRFKGDGPEIILPGLEWQMPQGGIDAGEDPRAAVMRELWEETSRQIPRPAPEMVRVTLHRPRR